MPDDDYPSKLYRSEAGAAFLAWCTLGACFLALDAAATSAGAARYIFVVLAVIGASCTILLIRAARARERRRRRDRAGGT